MSDPLIPAPDSHIEPSASAESEASTWAWSSVRELLTFVMHSSGTPTEPEDSTLPTSTNSTSLFDHLDQIPEVYIELSEEDLDTIAGGFFRRLSRRIGQVARPIASL